MAAALAAIAVNHAAAAVAKGRDQNFVQGDVDSKYIV